MPIVESKLTPLVVGWRPAVTQQQACIIGCCRLLVHVELRAQVHEGGEGGGGGGITLLVRGGGRGGNLLARHHDEERITTLSTLNNRSLVFILSSPQAHLEHRKLHAVRVVTVTDLARWRKPLTQQFPLPHLNSGSF